MSSHVVILFSGNCGEDHFGEYPGGKLDPRSLVPHFPVLPWYPSQSVTQAAVPSIWATVKPLAQDFSHGWGVRRGWGWISPPASTIHSLFFEHVSSFPHLLTPLHKKSQVAFSWTNSTPPLPPGKGSSGLGVLIGLLQFVLSRRRSPSIYPWPSDLVFGGGRWALTSLMPDVSPLHLAKKLPTWPSGTTPSHCRAVPCPGSHHHPHCPGPRALPPLCGGPRSFCCRSGVARRRSLRRPTAAARAPCLSHGTPPTHNKHRRFFAFGLLTGIPSCFCWMELTDAAFSLTKYKLKQPPHFYPIFIYKWMRVGRNIFISEISAPCHFRDVHLQHWHPQWISLVFIFMQVFDAAIQAESGQSRASKASLEPVIDVFSEWLTSLTPGTYRCSKDQGCYASIVHHCSWFTIVNQFQKFVSFWGVFL